MSLHLDTNTQKTESLSLFSILSNLKFSSKSTLGLSSLEFSPYLNKNEENKIAIRDIMEQRNIEWLCHFTPRSNLECIKKEGLKLRDVTMTVTDSARYDQNRSAICLSISKPNKWMFQKKQEQGFDLCLLLINPAVLYQKSCLFYPHNAATASYRNIAREQLNNSKALEEMFENPISFQRSGRDPQSIWRMGHLHDCETTSDQAEVQCLENIEPQYIGYIFEEDTPLTYHEIYIFIKQKREEQKRILEEIFSSEKEKEEERKKEKHQQEQRQREQLEKERKEREKRAQEVKQRAEESRKAEEKRRQKREAEKNDNSLDLTNYTPSRSSKGDGCLGILILIIILYFLFG